MPDFDIDNLKKTWQQQPATPKYDSSTILNMLNQKSRNYVKYIFWISIAEFLFFLGLTLYYIYYGDDSKSFENILNRLGVRKTPEIEANLAHFYFLMKVLSLLITGVFVYLFYKNYKKINIEENLKKHITQIIRFKRTVNSFILSQLVLLLVFTIAIAMFIFGNISKQNVQLDSSTLTGIVIGLIVGTVITGMLVLLYYRVLYGIIMKRLEKNLKQLQEIEAEE